MDVCVCVNICNGYILMFAQLCPTLCDLMDCSPPSSSVHGVFQARILEWVASPTLGDLPYPGIEPSSLASPALAGGFFATAPLGSLAVHWWETANF